MRYLGVAKKEKDRVLMPDSFRDIEDGQLFEAVEISGDIILLPSPLDRERLARVERFARRSIEEHRKSLEGLAR